MIASGDRIAHYHVIRKLGEGGMGEVYRAVDERLRRNVALKVLPPARAAESGNQARLIREAQAASHLNHPNIVTVHDVGIWDERVYIVMELVEGRRVSELIRTGIEPRAAVLLCAQAARALAVAHDRGILHRDIKPDNLMVTADGRLKILDFGLAKLRNPDGTSIQPEDPPDDARDATLPTSVPTPARAHASQPGLDDERASAPTIESPPPGVEPAVATTTPVIRTPARGGAPIARLSPWPSSPLSADPVLTAVDSLLGTPAYMSPEQAMRAPLDARSEIFSLGLVLYEMLTGARPYGRATVEETIEAAAAGALPALDASDRIPKPIARVLRRALAKNPADRYRDMTELAGALEEVARDLTPRRGRVLAIVAGAAVVATAATIGIVSRGRDEPPVSFEIRATRALSTEPSCEEYPAFTPDGHEIVFDGVVDGDTEIMAISVDGRSRRRLTHSPGWDIGATVSPDGKRVAYVHFGDEGRELRVIGIDGDRASPPVTIGKIRGFPSWTRSGLLYADDTETIWRATGDGSGAPIAFARLPADYLATALDEFPDGELVLALRARAQTTSQVMLALAQPSETARALVPPTTASDAAVVRVDRDGRGIYYVAARAAGRQLLHWRPRRGGAPSVIESMHDVTNGFAVSPQADRLVYSTCGTRSHIGTIVDGTFQPTARLAPEWEPAAFVPLADGELIVLSTRSGSTPQLWRVQEDGSAVRLVDEPARSPALSRDGRQLVWAGLAPGPPGIFVRELPDGAIRRLTAGDTDDAPAFSHDGATVFFARTDADGSRVYAIPLAGEAPPVPVSPPGVVSFAVDPARARIAVIVTVDGQRVIQLGAPGEKLRALALRKPDAYSRLSFSADGTRLVLQPSPSSLVELALLPDGTAGAMRPLWSRPLETVHTTVVTPDGALWALVSADEGDLYLVDGTFR